jgi:hypothetical protein
MHIEAGSTSKRPVLCYIKTWDVALIPNKSGTSLTIADTIRGKDRLVGDGAG